MTCCSMPQVNTNPDPFDEGYFIVPFYLAAMQDKRESQPLAMHSDQHPTDLQKR